MSKRIHILGSAFNIIGGLFGMLGWLIRFARLMLVPKAVLAAKLLVAESEAPLSSLHHQSDMSDDLLPGEVVTFNPVADFCLEPPIRQWTAAGGNTYIVGALR